MSNSTVSSAPNATHFSRYFARRRAGQHLIKTQIGDIGPQMAPSSSQIALGAGLSSASDVDGLRQFSKTRIRLSRLRRKIWEQIPQKSLPGPPLKPLRAPNSL